MQIEWSDDIVKDWVKTNQCIYDESFHHTLVTQHTAISELKYMYKMSICGIRIEYLIIIFFM